MHAITAPLDIAEKGMPIGAADVLDGFHRSDRPRLTGQGRDERKFSSRFLELLITILYRLQKLIVADSGQTLQGIVDEPAHIPFTTTALARFAVFAIVESL